ncbi:MAG: hypothetical protein V4564_13640 [Pseudomonadota bacterium]
MFARADSVENSMLFHAVFMLLFNNSIFDRKDLETGEKFSRKIQLNSTEKIGAEITAETASFGLRIAPDRTVQASGERSRLTRSGAQPLDCLGERDVQLAHVG